MEGEAVVSVTGIVSGNPYPAVAKTEEIGVSSRLNLQQPRNTRIEPLEEIPKCLKPAVIQRAIRDAVKRQ